jgi:hypothetical protein
MGKDVSDEVLIPALAGFVCAAEQVIKDPHRWLGMQDESEKGNGSLVQRSLVTSRKKVFGHVNPASSVWGAQSVTARVDWWVQRIGMLAGAGGAATHVSTVGTDQMQDALGAASSSLLVCAVAHEHGRQDRNEWIPIIARVVFDREIATDTRLMTADEDLASQQYPDLADSRVFGSASSMGERVRDRVNHGVRVLWDLAGAFRNFDEIFANRPRGSRIGPGLGKVARVKAVGTFFAERDALKRAAEKTQALLR